jgi:NADH:ubiquinone oxidoreductase subunit 4 (subunit M)
MSGAVSSFRGSSRATAARPGAWAGPHSKATAEPRALTQAAIMLKLGAYGFLRFSMPIAPDASHRWAWLMVALSLVAVVYIGLVALVQQDTGR